MERDKNVGFHKESLQLMFI